MGITTIVFITKLRQFEKDILKKQSYKKSTMEPETIKNGALPKSQMSRKI